MYINYYPSVKRTQRSVWYFKKDHKVSFQGKTEQVLYISMNLIKQISFSCLFGSSASETIALLNTHSFIAYIF